MGVPSIRVAFSARSLARAKAVGPAEGRFGSRLGGFSIGPGPAFSSDLHSLASGCTGCTQRNGRSHLRKSRLTVHSRRRGTWLRKGGLGRTVAGVWRDRGEECDSKRGPAGEA